MKMFTIILITCLIYGCSPHNNNDFIQKDSLKENIKCQLMESPVLSVHCGIQSVSVAMKFKILGNDSGDTIFIGIVPCPEMYGNNFFSVNTLYRVNLSDTSNTKYDLNFNPYEKQKLPTFFISKILKINE